MSTTKLSLISCGKTAKGFTLLELLVVSILTIIVGLITAQFWMWFSPSLNDLVGRWHLLREGRTATLILASDFGSAVGATPVGENRIILCKDAGDNPNGIADWAAPDVLVDYYLTGGTLVRNDSSGGEFAVADGVSGFTVESIPPSSIKMTLDLRSSTAARQLVFYWNIP
jgi:type II secretory pathway pseudopilin PulG